MTKSHNADGPMASFVPAKDSTSSQIGAAARQKPGLGRYWVGLYTALMVLLLLGVLVAALLNVTSLTRDLVHALNLSTAKHLLLAESSFVGLIAAFSLIERRYPAGPLPTLRTWVLNLKMYLVIVMVAPLVGALLGICLGYVSQVLNLGLFRLKFPAAWSVFGPVAAYLIWEFASDFFYYWFHRFQHESLLWQQHKLHHLDEQLCALTTGRNHWLEGLLYIPARLLPLAILIKLDPASGGLAGAMVAFVVGNWRTFNHANIRMGFGSMSWLLTSPQLHRVHHSRLPEHQNKNFASVFPILDVLFGTFYRPQPTEFPPTGVHQEPDILRLSQALALPFREWVRMLRVRRGRHAYPVARATHPG
jgi:sterol desaturase/sphingolipid hydroxylase (fatty acid hydroxylase superfamily)